MLLLITVVLLPDYTREKLNYHSTYTYSYNLYSYVEDLSF